MTPERQKWWDSLPQRERELREAIAERRKWIKIDKSYLPDGTTDIEYAKYLLRRQKLIVKALKHELERGGRAEIEILNERGIDIFTCQNCNAMLHIGDNEPVYKFCPWCGRKIKRTEV